MDVERERKSYILRIWISGGRYEDRRASNNLTVHPCSTVGFVYIPTNKY